MRLVVDGFGKFIGKSGNLIVIREKEKGKVKREGKEKKYKKTKTKKVDPSELTQVIVSGRVSLSTDAIELLLKNAIDVVFINKRGDISGRLSHPLIGMANTRREQYLAYNDERSVFLSREFILAKLRNQMAVLSNLAKARKESKKDVARAIMYERSKIEEAIHMLAKVKGTRIEEVREEMLGIEGKASNHYWDAVKLIFPSEYRFYGRRGLDQKHSRYAQDIINAMLNYGYAILHSECIRAVELAGLDPYAGFLHCDRSGRTSLALDLIEEFRQQIVDKAVIKLISYKQIKHDECEFENFVCILKDKARKKLLKEVLERLEKKTQYAGRNITYSSIIHAQARRIAKFLRGKGKYEGFWQRW